MILIHTALQCEAQCIIEKYKLQKISSAPKIYSDINILVLIGGVGKENTIKSLSFVLNKYRFTKAINLGIAGCSDPNIPTGAIFSSFNQNSHLKYKKLITVDIAQTINYNDNLLYDMEAAYFLEITQQYFHTNNIEIIKVVSDHLDDRKPNKEMVKQLMYKNMKEVLKNIEIN